MNEGITPNELLDETGLPGSREFELWAATIHPCRAPFEIPLSNVAVEIRAAHGAVSLLFHRDYLRALATRILETLLAQDVADAQAELAPGATLN